MAERKPMTQHPLADALREAYAIIHALDLPVDHPQADALAALNKRLWQALSQYEKSDTDRDQLREELLALKPHLPEFGFDTFVSVPEPLIHRILAALASKTAIDPATVERCAQIADEEAEAVGDADNEAGDYWIASCIARRIRALGKDQ